MPQNAKEKKIIKKRRLPKDRRADRLPQITSSACNLKSNIWFLFTVIHKKICQVTIQTFFFPIACYATLHPALSVLLSVGPSVHPWVRASHLTFLASMGFLALLLLPKCSTDLKYGPCPPECDWGSRLSGLVYYHEEWNYWF